MRWHKNDPIRPKFGISVRSRTSWDVASKTNVEHKECTPPQKLNMIDTSLSRLFLTLTLTNQELSTFTSRCGKSFINVVVVREITNFTQRKQGLSTIPSDCRQSRIMHIDGNIYTLPTCIIETTTFHFQTKVYQQQPSNAWDFWLNSFAHTPLSCKSLSTARY